MSGVDFGILGPLSVRVDGRELALPAGKHRVVLAALLLGFGQVVSIGELIEYLWADSPPPGARRTAQTYVMRLRRAFAPHVPIASHRDGYLLHVEQHALDLHRFRATVTEADEAARRGDLAGEIALLRSGLSLWRGPVLADVPSEPLHAVASMPLAEERLQVLERVVDRELTAGRHRELVAELRTLTAEHPLRERFWADLMLALYRGGRQAEALEAFRTVDARLREELGIEPGEALQRLHQAVLIGRIEPERAAVAVPSVAPWVARCTLPLDVGAYVGRTEQTLELVRTLTAGGSAGSVPVVAVCGPPGVGKTALAVRVAHRVRAEFPDGQWYLRLGGRDPAELLAELLHATGLSRAKVPETTDAMAAQLRARLADRRVLLLLDDAADAAQVRPLLPGTPGCAVLVTSRVDLGGLAALNGATIHVLEVLRSEDADSLFAALLDTTAGDEARLAEIARLCGYLPLALRVAAANLVQRGGRTEEYLAELRAGDRLGRLAVVGDPQAAVRATFDVSYLALPEPVRRLFRLLGLVPGREFDQGAAAALLGGDDREAAAQLAHLAMCHLVESPSAGRFQFHDLMRLYAAERAAADEDPAERTAAVRRLYEHYLDIADGAGAVLYPDLSRLPRNRPHTRFASAEAARDALDAEHAGLVAAIKAAEDAGQGRFAWHLTDALRGYFHSRGMTPQWAAAANTALAAATRAGEHGAAAAMRMSLGMLAWTLGRHDEALGELSLALDAARADGLTAIEGAALSNLGVVNLEMGRLHAAAELFRAGQEHGRRTAEDFVTANSLLNLGAALLELGRPAEATESSTAALELCTRLASPHAEATARSNLGQALLAEGRLDEAEQHLRSAMVTFRAIGSIVDTAETTTHLAALHRDAGHTGEGLRQATAAVELARTVGVGRVLGEALVVLGTVERSCGRNRAAADRFRSALDLLPSDGHGRVAGEARIGLSVACRELGDPAAAELHARAALDLAESAGREAQRGAALTALALALAANGDVEYALDLAERAVQIQSATGHRAGADQASDALRVVTQAVGLARADGQGRRGRVTGEWRPPAPRQPTLPTSAPHGAGPGAGRRGG